MMRMIPVSLILAILGIDCGQKTQTDWISQTYEKGMAEKKRIRLKVAAPCSADWSAMKGDDAVRHCGQCDKDVYELSHMKSEEIEALLAKSSSKTCVRFYQRKDGTVLTSDCSVGVKKRRRKQAIAGLGAGALSALGFAFSGAAVQTPPPAPEPDVAVVKPEPPAPEVQQSEPANKHGLPYAQPNPDHELIMGDVEYVPEPEAELRMGQMKAEPMDHKDSK